MRTIELKVQERDVKIRPQAIRRQGRIPAVVYGAGGENVPLSVDAREFSLAGLGGGSHLIKFCADRGSLNDHMALVKSVQTHPVQGSPLHIDFLRVDLTKPVEAPVAIRYTGKCMGVITSGGILQPIRREIIVRALPHQLPEEIEVDVTDLDIHGAVHREELQLPEGVEAVDTENYTLVTVVPPVVEKVEEPVEGEEGLEAAEGGTEAAEGEAAESEPNKASE